MKNNLIVDSEQETLKGMLDGDFSAILLTKKRTYDGIFLVSQSVPGDVVGDREEDKWVESYLETI